MDAETLNYIIIKRNNFKLTKKYPQNVMILERFKFYRNLVSKKIIALKKNFYQNKFQKCCHDPKETWRSINNILRNTDSQKVEHCTTIKVNNVPTTNKHHIVEHFNSFFVTVAD